MKHIKEWDMTDLMPVIILAIVALAGGVLTRGKVFSSQNMLNIVNQSVPYFLAGLGMIFVVAMGGTDITCGSIIGLAGAIGAMAATKISVWLMFPAAIFVGAVIGMVSGVVVSKFKVPSFMTTLSMLLAVRAMVNWLLESTNVIATPAMLVFDRMYVKLPIMIALILGFSYLFHYTPFGAYVHAIGENELAVEHTGVSVSKVKIVAFMISGALAGVASIFMVVRLGGASNTMGSSMEMKVMLCMFLASIPVEGGAGTKMYKMVIGVLTYFILDNGLTLLGGSSVVNQMVRGVVLIAALYATRLAAEATERRNVRRAAEEQADVGKVA
jgi:ribose transport system permease protein